MWEFSCDTGACRKRGAHLLLLVAALLIHVTGSTGDKRTGRLVVISSRQFTPGTSGVGEVISVDAHEFERLVKEENISVVRGGVVDGGNTSAVISGGDGELELDHAGVIPNSSNASNVVGADIVNPVVILPEDSSRGQQQDTRFVPIDRRKVPGDGGGGPPGNSDLSFTGILNGLLDSFINDSPPQHHRTPPPSSPSTTEPPQEQEQEQLPMSEESSVQEEEEEEEEVEDEEESPEESMTTTGKKSSNSQPPPPAPPATTEDVSTENASEYPTEDEEEPPQPHQNTTKQCQGECRNIIFGLFLCDEIDNDAFCPEAGLACCVNNPEPEYVPYKPYGNGSSEEVDHNSLKEEPSLEEVVDEEEEEDHVAAGDKGQPPPLVQQVQQVPVGNQPHRYNNYNNRLPPPPHYNVQQPPPPHQFYYPPPHQKNPPPMMHAPPPRMPLPCPRYCVKNYHESYCSDRLPSQFACGMDAFCCSHPVNSIKDENKQDDEENGEEQLLEHPVEQHEEDDPDVDVKKILGDCKEVGSCVNINIINIICFGHAIPTDMYTCDKTATKCCAKKSALPKDSLPPSTTPKPPPVPPLQQQPQSPLQKPENAITRNSSSYNPPKLQPQHPQILPQFAPQPPPHQHVYPTQQQQQFLHNPTPPPLAETPPPPIQNQFTSAFTSPQQLTRTPTRQPVGQYVCGVKGVPTVSKKRRRKRVVGGSDSLPGEWCWQVALINSLNQYLCGGALIGTQWVLTAAHCVTNIVRSGDAIYVRVGDHDLTSRYGSPGAQTLRVATTYIHHNHNSQTLDNDIALLKLQGNAALKEGVCLVCLPSRNHMSEIPGKRCTVTGYGYMGESGPIPLRIREANLPIVSDDECVRKVNAVTEKVFSLPQSSFCAGGDKSGNDACQGDGGGPLVCRADDPNLPDAGTGYYELTGLVSWGFGCGRESVPGVYVKVSSFIGWIHQIIRSN